MRNLDNDIDEMQWIIEGKSHCCGAPRIEKVVTIIHLKEDLYTLQGKIEVCNLCGRLTARGLSDVIEAIERNHQFLPEEYDLEIHLNQSIPNK